MRDVDKYAKYINDPVGFAKDILKIDLVPKQAESLRLLLVPPYKVLNPSGHEQGKSVEAACGVIWWHCTRSPAIIITTAPTDKQVKDILWKEIRRLARRARMDLPFLPKACRIERAPDDFVHGGTARDDTAFQGQHGPNQLFVVDEATGVDGLIFEAIEGMFSPPGHACLFLFNPTNTGTRIYQEYVEAQKMRGGQKSAHVVRMSALDHPNIEAELKGEPPVIPHAMRLDKFDRLFRKWSQLVGCEVDDTRLQLATDVVWPPVWATDYCERTKRIPRVWRPGPLAESRLLGRYPRQGIANVFSEGDWIAATREGMPILAFQLRIPEIGFDCARFGDDYSATHIRSGWKSLHHEEVNGQDTVRSSQRLMELADHYATWYNEQIAAIISPAERGKFTPITGRSIPIKIDDDGVGGGVTDQVKSAGYKAMPVSAASKALDFDSYPNRRSELCFTTAERARDGELDISGLVANDDGTPRISEFGEPMRLFGEEVVAELRQQAMNLTWTMDSRGRRVVAPKDEQKKTLGRSPDGLDSMNLAYCETEDMGALPEVILRRKSPFAR